METRVGVDDFEKLREVLNKKAMERGLDHPEVLALSRKLDAVHNELLKK